MMFDLGVTIATDGPGPLPDDVSGSLTITSLNGPQEADLVFRGDFNWGFVMPGVWMGSGWVGIMTPEFFLPPGWKWVINGRLTILMDPDDGFLQIDYTQIPSDFRPDLGYIVPEPGSLLVLLSGSGWVLLLYRRRRVSV
jgi:hypothetical protein